MSLPLPGFSPLLFAPSTAPEPPAIEPGPPSPRPAEEDRTSFARYRDSDAGLALQRRWSALAARLLAVNRRLDAITPQTLDRELAGMHHRLFVADWHGDNLAFGDGIWLLIDQGMPALERVAALLEDEEESSGGRSVEFARLIDRLDACADGLMTEIQTSLNTLGRSSRGLAAQAGQMLERLLDAALCEHVRRIGVGKQPQGLVSPLDIHRVNAYRRAILPLFGLPAPKDRLAAPLANEYVRSCLDALRASLRPALLVTSLADEALAAWTNEMAIRLSVDAARLIDGVPWDDRSASASRAASDAVVARYGPLPEHALMEVGGDGRMRVPADASLLARHLYIELQDKALLVPGANDHPERLVEGYPVARNGGPRLEPLVAIETLGKGLAAWKLMRGHPERLVLADLELLTGAGREDPALRACLLRIALANTPPDEGVVPASWMIDVQSRAVCCDCLSDERLQAALARHGRGFRDPLRHAWQVELVRRQRHALLSAEHFDAWNRPARGPARARALAPALLREAFAQPDAHTRDAVLMRFLDLGLTNDHASSLTMRAQLRAIACPAVHGGLWQAMRRQDAAALATYVMLIGESAAMGWLHTDAQHELLLPASTTDPQRFWRQMTSERSSPRLIQGHLRALGELVTGGRLSVAGLLKLFAPPRRDQPSAFQLALRGGMGQWETLLDGVLSWRRSGVVDEATLHRLLSGDAFGGIAQEALFSRLTTALEIYLAALAEALREGLLTPARLPALWAGPAAPWQMLLHDGATPFEGKSLQAWRSWLHGVGRLLEVLPMDERHHMVAVLRALAPRTPASCAPSTQERFWRRATPFLKANIRTFATFAERAWIDDETALELVRAQAASANGGPGPSLYQWLGDDAIRVEQLLRANPPDDAALEQHLAVDRRARMSLLARLEATSEKTALVGNSGNSNSSSDSNTMPDRPIAPGLSGPAAR